MSSRRTISNTFTVTTMDDPVSVQAQYSPDKVTIHTTWQNGDLYMRTRESDDVAWSDWHRIVGESGGATNYMFALSAYKVSQDGTSATAPSDISSSDWQDAPMATTTQKPYLWSKVQKKDGNGNNVGNPRYIRLTGEDGTSPYFADIDNEMVSVACDKNGNITAAFSKTVGLHLWRGSTEIAIDSLSATLNGTTITSSGTVGNITITLDKTAKTLAVSVANGEQIAATNDIAITLSGGGSGTHKLHFVLNGVRAGNDGSPAVIYDLIPSASSVKCDSSNTLTPAKLTCNVQRTEGTTISSATSAHGTLYYKKNGDINSSSDGRSLTIDTGEVTLAASDKFVVFAFFVGTTMVDKERVPVVKDGQNMRENLIDKSKPAYEVTAPGSGQKHRITDKTYEPDKLPEAGTKVSGQARIKCVGCTFLSDPRIIVYIENEYPNAWMHLIDIETEEDWAFLSSEGNGTIDAKREGITLPPNNGYPWDGKVRLRIDNLVSGTVSVERVKLEVGEKCSDWCLSENDKVGTSPYFADLNNEMDAIQCKHDGGVITTQTVSTVISMWKGSSVEAFVIDKIYRNGTQLTWGSTSNGVKPSKSGSTVSIEFGTNASIANIDDFKITIYSYNDNTVTRELHFTINGVRANAIYRLVPSHSQIVKKKDGTYVPSGNVTCSVEKTENGSTSTPSSSEYTLEKSVNGGSYTTYSATAASSITSDLKFRLKVGGVVVDLETIPLVSDGDKGDGGVSYSIVFTKAAARVGANNTVTAELAGYAYKYVGGVRSALESTTIRYGYILSDDETYTEDTTDSDGFFDAGNWFNGDDIHNYGKDSPSIFAAIIIGGNIVHAEFITISEKGETGSRGKTGRFYYYGGEFDNTDTTKTFKINDAETPYFSHGTNAVTGLPNCHVYNPSTNPSSDLTMAQMWANSNQSWNNAPWQTFTNDFQYLMTRAVFSDQAYLGSFVVNTDWLISQHGKVNHVASTAYTKFYPEFVNGGDLCENFDVDVNYILAGSAYFVGGKKYYIKVGGSSFSSGCQLKVRMYNGSSNVGNTINLTSSSPNGIITFEPTTSGTYYLRADCQSSGMTAKLTAYVDCFVPNFAVDGLTGKTYQNDAYIKGNIYRPALTINNSNYSTYAPKNQNNVYVIDLKKTGLNILLDFNLSTGTLLIDLPYGDEYIGAEVTIINNSNKCAYIETILWGEGDASFPIYGYSGYAHFKYVKVTNSGNTVGKWWVLGSIYDPGNYVNV